jgi:hypothetical protein
VVRIRTRRRRIGVGDFVDVRIEAANQHDLEGTPA